MHIIFNRSLLFVKLINNHICPYISYKAYQLFDQVSLYILDHTTVYLVTTSQFALFQYMANIDVEVQVKIFIIM